ncbi:hypothetical protein COCSADRAFT_141515 [Bipolaris sorokiniana ND90Pr]|uniref:DUF7730 domain-containing protein n=1 Tax=Cochliobolus sativus (strain ND90Pr / ATCC 201652) TaxID=665912 RepID=M2RE47_COCSN|nr:uncharacterized protein COCSADRAFT_141515 [Bipolaris sorokiniana ND90Pr]EMD65039.1 hypothetical protein COCSADRAFT_141515 [Bipolaris sorokiniana ND90Pr]
MALQHPKHPPNGTTPPWTQSHNRDETAIGFLDLPRELRDLVYDFAFRIQGALLIYTRDPTAARLVARAMNIQHAGRGPSAPQPLVNGALPVALLRTCRQLNAESSPILYSANVFSSWNARLLELSLAHRNLLVRHIVMEASPRGIFDKSLEHVEYCWKNRFWPEILKSGKALLDYFPNLESLTFSLKPPRGDELWRPGFFAVGGNKTREQRVGIVALWMSLGCCWADADQGLKACLHLEMGRQPARIGRDEFVGSKFAPEEEEDDGVWDYTEFADAFDRMKGF